MCSVNPRKTLTVSGKITSSHSELKVFLSDRYINLSLGLWQMCISRICYFNTEGIEAGQINLSSNFVTGFVCRKQGQSEKNYPLLTSFVAEKTSGKHLDFTERLFLINNPSDELAIFVDIESAKLPKKFVLKLNISVDFLRVQ